MLVTSYIVTTIVAPGLRRLTGGGLFMTIHGKLQYLLNIARSSTCDGPILSALHGFHLVAKFSNYFWCEPFENDYTFLGNPKERISWFQVVFAPIVQRYSEIQAIADATRCGLFDKLVHN